MLKVTRVFLELGALARQHELDITDTTGLIGVGVNPAGVLVDDGAVVTSTLKAVLQSPSGMDWVGLDDGPLPVGEASSWAVRPDCGAVVSFAGTVRDHSDGRLGVSCLEYEAYRDQVAGKLAALAGEARRRWPELGRLVLLHRLGLLELGEVSVVVVVSAPHRAQAFDAARWCIDTLKTTVPIWKRESWSGGSAWAQGASEVEVLGGG